MKKQVWPVLVVIVLFWVGHALAQNSPGGAFLTNFAYIIGGQWTWRSQASPFIFEGTTDDGFETTFTVTNPTADRTFTLPNATGGTFVFSSLSTNGIDVVNSIWGVSNGLGFEGATADAFETTLSPTDVGVDITLTLPGLANASGAILASTLTTNDLDAANSLWGVSNGLRFEGATADGFETTVSPTDVGADVAVTLPGGANAAYAVFPSTLTTNDVDVVNSVWGASNGLVFEGATANTFELTLSPADVGADRAVTIPDMGAASALLASTLTTNAPDAANSLWGASNALVFEGVTADAFELTLAPADVGADRTVTIPDMGAASALLASTLTTNAAEVLNSLWGASNALVFEGLTADGFETSLSPTDVGGDITLTLPGLGNASGAILASTLTTNDLGIANSVWGVSAGFVFEGTDADTEELTLTTQDLTADITVRFRDDLVDTYEILTMPDADVTAGHWQIPEVGAADADLVMTDNTLYVYRVYLPHWITVANVYARTTQGADVAGTDDLLGVAIYEDADAGTQLTEAVSADVTATADVTFDVANVTLGPGFYRVAVCSGDGSGATFVADTMDDEFIDVANLGVVTIGTGANACVTGNPPATTGALTTADINFVVLKMAA